MDKEHLKDTFPTLSGKSSILIASIQQKRQNNRTKRLINKFKLIQRSQQDPEPNKLIQIQQPQTIFDQRPR